MTEASPIHRTPGRMSNYDRFPFVDAGSRSQCAVGWDAVIGAIRATSRRVIVVDAYPGVADSDLLTLAKGLEPDTAIAANAALKPSTEIDRMIYPDLTSDPVFGRLTHLTLHDFFDPVLQEEIRTAIRHAPGTVVVYGTGASLITEGDLLIYADMPRREAQLRQRRNSAPNLGTTDLGSEASLQYKRAFFVDWRVCDAHKKTLFGHMDFILDTCVSGQPKMITGAVLRRSLQNAAARPLRLVPWFDPAPWGGRWLMEVCDLDRATVNYGWAFDCVPEENSLLLRFGDICFETPALNLVYLCSGSLLGPELVERFGAEFPIRFDFLDTMEGGNLSLQVHPLTEYIRQQFGMPYTQDESYYLMDADPDARVYLGLHEGIDPKMMMTDLRRAERGETRFPDEVYINRMPAKRHDHFLIPAGTVHCSGAGSVVLEISATPYIFTFKLWDWGRLGLDGIPRPVHLDHGERNLVWERDTAWTEANLVNLVEGDEVEIVSPTGAFVPYTIHYAETFIVPAAVGPYLIRRTSRSQSDRF